MIKQCLKQYSVHSKYVKTARPLLLYSGGYEMASREGGTQSSSQYGDRVDLPPHFKKKYDVHIYWFWCILTAASGDHGVMHAATDIQLFLASEKYSYKLLWIL